MAKTQEITLLQGAIAAAKAGDKAGAWQILLEVVAVQPDSELGWLWLAHVAPDADEAIRCLARALAINPANGNAGNALKSLYLRHGVACAKAGERERARRLLQKAAEMDAQNPLVWQWLAWSADRPAESAQALERALAINPDDAKTRSWLLRLRSQEQPVPALPAAAPADGVRGPAAAERARPRRSSATALPVPPPRRVALVVDDSATVRKIVQVILEREGFVVHLAGDGMQALAKMGEELPDVIFLDITMPHLDGYQVCKIVRESDATRDVPVLMLSGRDGFFDKVRGRLAGATDYVTKPFEPATLLGLLEKHLPRVPRTR